MKLDYRLKAIQVSCYSGYKANERPINFTFRGRTLIVHEVLDQWYGINHSYFKVLADDSKIYLIGYDHDDDLWTLEKILGSQRG
ncbi:MAG: hypothetical protein DRG87_03200 [Deltaproteobacteria bacterium]|nr:hypothetical protein [Deltaproteobacteria bacterium]MBW2077186.1 hypothetical protein [Deltaproteobacteria bacterium]MBW2310577.1 hypothetical protein [Deltaproteobacteria bacterium]RLB31164.1 MAG: hypothetical protein DRG87_03200 [Deltaproteobacteria bacterium]